MTFRFSTTPFFNTRQFYWAVESGAVDPGPDVDLEIEHNHSPVKDQKLLCGGLDATTMSMGKYVSAKLVSHTDVVPVDPLAVAAGLTYREGNGIFVPADSDVSDPQDLAGARVGIHDTTLAMTYHKAVLESRYDVGPDDVEWVVDTHQGLADRMDRGELDALERINDWYWAMRDGDGYRLVYDMGREWNDLYGYPPLVHLVAVDSGVRQAAPGRVESFLTALRASRDYRDAHHDEVLRAFLEENDGGEWEGERTVDALRRVTDGVRCPFVLGDDQRRNVLDWMRHAVDYEVFESAPISEERLFPEQ